VPADHAAQAAHMRERARSIGHAWRASTSTNEGAATPGRGGHMSRNIATLVFGCALALAVSGGAAEAAKVHRDWKAHPVVVEVDTSEDIFAIGDAHADPQRLAGALAGAKLIASAASPPDQVKWTGGKSILVIPGDMIDKWTDSLGVITLLRTLQKDAATHGGRVIITMGNHEAEFLADPLGHKTSEFSAELKAAGLNPEDVGDCKGDLGQFLCALPIAVRVNDWFFCHAGNTDDRSIKQITKDIEDGVDTDGFATKQLVGDNSILEARLNKKGPNGLPWFDDGKPSSDPQKLLAKYVDSLGVKHLVQGHQYNEVKFPDKEDRKEEHFFQRYGLLFLIDTGMSRGIEDSDSIGGALHIKGSGDDQKAVVICPNGDEKTLWDKTWDKKKNDREEHLCK
jgi:hypothetical protein